jgi:hypothetical protein
MKFLKQSQLNFGNVSDQSIAVVTDGPNVAGVNRDARIVLDNTNSVQLPIGITDERPSGGVVLTNGLMRYNETTNEIEVRSNNQWRRLAYKEPGIIEVQTGPVGGGASWLGDSLDGGTTGEIYYGPLEYSDVDGNGSLYPAKGAIDATTPQNLIVYIENVPQLPNTNYTLENLDGSTASAPTGYLLGANYPAGTYIKFVGAVPYGKPVTVLHGFDR